MEMEAPNVQQIGKSIQNGGARLPSTGQPAGLTVKCVGRVLNGGLPMMLPFSLVKVTDEWPAADARFFTKHGLPHVLVLNLCHRSTTATGYVQDTLDKLTASVAARRANGGESAGYHPQLVMAWRDTEGKVAALLALHAEDPQGLQKALGELQPCCLVMDGCHRAHAMPLCEPPVNAGMALLFSQATTTLEIDAYVRFLQVRAWRRSADCMQLSEQLSTADSFYTQYASLYKLQEHILLSIPALPEVTDDQYPAKCKTYKKVWPCVHACRRSFTCSGDHGSNEPQHSRCTCEQNGQGTQSDDSLQVLWHLQVTALASRSWP